MDIEKRLEVARREGAGRRMDWEFGISNSMDEQQGPTIQHREPYSNPLLNHNGEEYGKEYMCMYMYMGFHGGSDSKESACNAGDLGLIPRSGRSLGEGNVYPLQYNCLENSMDRRAWRATVLRVTKSQTQLSY